MQNRSFQAILLLLLSTFLLLCYGQGARGGWIEERDGTTIIHVTVSRLPDPTSIDPASRAASAMVEAFKRDFPRLFEERYYAEYCANQKIYGHYSWEKVAIELEPFTGIQVEGVESDLLAIAGGMAPDVLYVNFRKSDNYIQNDFLYPLDHYFAQMTREEIDLRVNSRLWPVIQRKGPNGQEHIWMLPTGGALGKVLLYRKDLFESAGIPFPTLQWTWDDLLDASRRLTNPAKGTYGIFLRRGKQESWYWLTFLWSAGGEVMTYDEQTDRWKCIFDSEAAAVALDFYTRLSTEKWIDETGETRRGYSTKDASDAGTKWNRGQIGMMFGYIDEKMFTTLNPDQVGIIPVPLGPTGIRAAELNSRMMGLFSQIPEPAVRDAAWEYMRFYDSVDALRIKTTIMVNSGLGAFVNPRYLHRFGYDEIIRLASPQLAETYETAIATGRPEPYGRNSNFAYDLMTYPITEAEQLALHDKLPTDAAERLALMQGLLKNACSRANEIMLDDITPRDRTIRRISAAVLLIGMLIGSWFAIRRMFNDLRIQLSSESHQPQPLAAHLRKYAWSYILLLPALLTIFTWKYIPLLRGAGMAFFDYRLLGASSWTGLDNFGNMLFDSFWWQSVYNALRYSLTVMLLTFLPPMVLALLLHEVPQGKRLFRFLYYLPAVITGLVTIVLWKQFYEPSENGTLNALVLQLPAWSYIAVGVCILLLCLAAARKLRYFSSKTAAVLVALTGLLLCSACCLPTLPILFPDGSSLLQNLVQLPGRLSQGLPEPVRWLSNPGTAMLSCVLPMVWAGMGPGCLIYLAAMKCIPEEYYEAADLDGAGFIDKILFVVFPHLKMLILINFTGAFISSWYAATANILVMTGGGAHTEVAGLHIWYKAFTFLQFGPATAMAWMLGFILIGFTVQQLTLLSRVEFRSASGSES